MTVLLHAVLVVHFLGLAALVGGTAVALTAAEPRISTVMLHGALTQLVSGFALPRVALREPSFLCILSRFDAVVVTHITTLLDVRAREIALAGRL
jgi:hypothetical protein